MQSDVSLCECFARDGLPHEQDFVPTRMALGDTSGMATLRSATHLVERLAR